VTGKNKINDNPELTYSSNPINVLWFKFFLADINQAYLQFLDETVFKSNEDKSALWDLVDAEVPLSYLQNTWPLFNRLLEEVPTGEQLAQYYTMGVEAAYIESLISLNLVGATRRNLLEIVVAGVDRDFLKQLKASKKPVASLREVLMRSYLKPGVQPQKGHGMGADQETFILLSNDIDYDKLNKKGLALLRKRSYALAPFDKVIVKGKLKVAFRESTKDEISLFQSDQFNPNASYKLQDRVLTITRNGSGNSNTPIDVVVSHKDLIDLKNSKNSTLVSYDLVKHALDNVQDRNIPYLRQLKILLKEAGVAGYQMMIMKDGEIFAHEVGGYKNAELKTPVDHRSLFPIASLAKPIYALALYRIIDEGYIGFDDPINKVLKSPIKHPNFPEIAISPRMLLAHTSGLKDNWEVFGPMYAPELKTDQPYQIGSFINDYLLPEGKYFNVEENFKAEGPGKAHEYANINYILICKILEDALGESAKSFIEKSIFQNLNMKDSYWYRQDIPHDNLAYPHLVEKDSLKVLEHYGYPGFPEGYIRTTVSDYAQILRTYMHGGKIDKQRTINPSSIEAAFKVQYPAINPHQLMTWNTNEIPSPKFYENIPHLPAHTGLDRGVISATIFDPETESAVIFFANTEPANFEKLIEALSLMCQMAGLKQ
ncbi:MAG: serine hydrolase domain-containing protein, partial [Bacteroidota bacterium]